MIYHVFANRSNIGDWLSARAIQSQLDRPVTELLCDEPFVEATLDALRKATPDDAIIIGGGGLFMDYFRPFWSGFDDVSARGVPFLIWGAGYCDAKDRPTRPPADLIQRIVRRSRLCVARDTLTCDALNDCGVTGPVPCPSVLALHRPDTKGRAVLHAVHYEITGPGGYDTLVDLVREFATRDGRAYLETNNEIEPDSERALAAELRLYERSERVVSTRLHGCIIGLALGCRVLALAGDRKVESFMHAAGLADWICDPRDSDAIRAKLTALHQQPSAEPFFTRARAANLAVGQRVRDLLAALQLVEDPT